MDIVIPYHHGFARWEELRYALRSIEKNLKAVYRIVIVGDLPPYINPDTVLHIPAGRVGGGPFPNLKEGNRKLALVLNDPRISDTIIVTYDDIYFCAAVSPEFLKIPIALYNSATVKRDNADNKYRQSLYSTYDALSAKGLPAFNYETHLPRLINKQQMLQVYNEFKPEKNLLQRFTLYYNRWATDRPVLYKKEFGIKAGFYGRNDNYGYGFYSTEKTLELIQGNIFCNHDDAGLSGQLKEALKIMFPDKCQYEL